MDVIEGFQIDIFIGPFIQILVGIRQHIVNILDFDLISHEGHPANLVSIVQS